VYSALLFLPPAANDIWPDLNTEREHAIIGLANGTPSSTRRSICRSRSARSRVAARPGATLRSITTTRRRRWHAYAYATTDAQTDKLAVIDLGGLPNHIALTARRTSETRAHTIYLGNVDYSTGVALDGMGPVLFTEGSDLSGGGFRAYGLTDPGKPESIVASPIQHYTHDASSLIVTDARKDTQCVHGSDSCAVYIDFNETTVDLWDYSDVRDPRQLSSTSYPNASFVHSGWPTEDGAYVFVQDELDEPTRGCARRCGCSSATSARQRSPAPDRPDGRDDHNGCVRGNRYYMSNYSASWCSTSRTRRHRWQSRADTYVPTDELVQRRGGTYPSCRAARWS
jgi:choice-of-anchor B domain-containing protein